MTLLDKNDTLDRPRRHGRLGRRSRSRDEIEEMINSLLDEEMRRLEEMELDSEDELEEVLEEFNSPHDIRTDW